MNRSVQQFRVTFLSAALLTVIVTVLRTLTLFFAFDREIGYFVSDAFAPTLLYALEVVCILWFFSLFFRAKEPVAFEKSEAPLSIHATVANGLIAIICAVIGIYLLIGSSTEISAPTPLRIFAALFLLAGLFHFLLPIFGKRAVDPLLFSGYGFIFGASLLISLTYLDRYTQMNAPHKVAQQLALLTVMLAVLLELRELIRPSRPRMCAVFSMTAFFLCATVGVSDLIATIGGVYHDVLYLLIDLLLAGFACRTGVKWAERFFEVTPCPAAPAAENDTAEAEPPESQEDSNDPPASL